MLDVYDATSNTQTVTTSEKTLNLASTRVNLSGIYTFNTTTNTVTITEAGYYKSHITEELEVSVIRNVLVGSI